MLIPIIFTANNAGGSRKPLSGDFLMPQFTSSHVLDLRTEREYAR
jgi:hypothetical protein